MMNGLKRRRQDLAFKLPIALIKDEGYFGDRKVLRENIWELRWVNGRRIYYSLIPVDQVLLLIGGNKNGQTKDINKAEKIYHRWIDD